jgi:hypothetical protein
MVDQETIKQSDGMAGGTAGAGGSDSGSSDLPAVRLRLAYEAAQSTNGTNPASQPAIWDAVAAVHETIMADRLAAIMAEHRALKVAMVKAVLPLEAMRIVGQPTMNMCDDLWTEIIAATEIVRSILTQKGN